MKTYFPHIDGLRALAVVAVVLYHINPSLLAGGFAGVDIFFVISGFVVTSSLANHSGESLTSFLGLFYARRLARIAPALMIVLIAITLAYILFIPQTLINHLTESVAQSAFWGFSNLILDQQSETYFSTPAEFNPYTHTWSLGIEEQYYLIAPALLFGWVRWREFPQRRRLYIAAMTLLAVSSLYACIRMAFNHGSNFVFYQITFRFWELAAGVLWFQLNAERRVTPQSHLPFWELGSWLGLSLTIFTLLFANPEAFPWPWALGAVVGTVLLIGDPYMAERGYIRWCFTRPQVVYIGLISYSLYLWHWPIIVLFRWTIGFETWFIKLIVLLLSIFLAAFSYRWIELPIRQNVKIKCLPTGLRITGFIIFIGMCWGGSRLLFNEQINISLCQSMHNFKEWHVGERMENDFKTTRQCEPRIIAHNLKGVIVREYYPEDCENRRSAQIFVIGDSHAGSYQPMLEQLSAEEGRIIRAYFIPGCPYIDLNKPMGESRPASCLSMPRVAMKEVLLLAHKGDIVFLPSLRLPRIVDDWGPVRSGIQYDDESVFNYRFSPNLLQSVVKATLDARQWFEPFERADLHVMFELPKPIFRSPPFRCVDFFNKLNPQCLNGLSEKRSKLEAFRAPIVEAIKNLAVQHPTVVTWDPFIVLCSKEYCNAIQEGHPLFFDADHISAYANLVLYPSFKNAIEQIDRQ